MRIPIIQSIINLILRKSTFREFKRNVYKSFIGKNIDYYNCKFDEIVSLGYDCEISQRLTDIFINGKFEHYLFTWSYENNRDLFIEALKHLNDFTETEYTLLQSGMVKHEKYNIAFHTRFAKNKLINSDGSPTDILPQAIEELKSRLNYLANKTENLFKSNKKVLFILKLHRTNLQEDIDYIEKLNETLKSKFCNKTLKYILMVVIEGKKYTKQELKLINSKTNKNIKYEAILHFAHGAYTDVSGDIFGWYRLLKKYLISTNYTI